jgi:hypothetical protein
MVRNFIIAAGRYDFACQYNQADEDDATTDRDADHCDLFYDICISPNF